MKNQATVLRFRNFQDFKYGTLEILFQNDREIIIDGILKKGHHNRCKFMKVIHGDRQV